MEKVSDASEGTMPPPDSVISMSCKSTSGLAEHSSPDFFELLLAFLACIGQICPG